MKVKAEVAEREVLRGLEELVEMGEAMERGENPMPDDPFGPTMRLAKFIDDHGRQLLAMAERGMRREGLQ